MIREMEIRRTEPGLVVGTFIRSGAMGVFSRISDIVNSNLNSILDKAQDPEKIIRLIIQEMEDTLVEVRTSAVKSIAEQKQLERKIASLLADQSDWQSKAELALGKDREDLAKAALQVKTRFGQEEAALRRRYEQIETDLVKQSEDVAVLQQKLADAKSREALLVSRHKSATNRLKIRASLYDERVTDAFARFEQVEKSLDMLEGKAEVYDIGRSRGAIDELAQMEADHQIDNELAALKAKMGKTE
jgi:phage shock protein A